MGIPPRPLRVLHTESSINMGGQELRILQQMRWLLNHGHDSWLLARGDAEIFAEAQRQGLPCQALRLRGSFNPAVTWKIARFWRQHRVDVVDCHSMRDASLLLPLRLLGWPVLHSQHICKELKADRAHRLVWRYGAQKILAVSQSIAERLVNQNLVRRERISIVGEAVDLTVYRSDLDGRAVRQQWGIPASAKVLSVIGMIRPDKAQHQLVRAAERICATVPEVRIMLVGSPTQKDYAEKMEREIAASPCRDRIIRTGFQKEVQNYIAASDLIVLTSRAEAQSMVIPQAFACRRAVVAPDLGGIPELVRDRQTGYLYAPLTVDREEQTIQNIAATVIEALQSDNGAMIDRAYDYAVRELSIDRQMERTLGLYRTVMGEN